MQRREIQGLEVVDRQTEEQGSGLVAVSDGAGLGIVEDDAGIEHVQDVVQRKVHQ